MLAVTLHITTLQGNLTLNACKRSNSITVQLLFCPGWKDGNAPALSNFVASVGQSLHDPSEGTT